MSPQQSLRTEPRGARRGMYPLEKETSGNGNMWGAGIGGFILLWVFIWVLMFTYRPSWIMCGVRTTFTSESDCRKGDDSSDDGRGRKGRDIDLTKLLWTSFVVTLIVFLIIWLIASGSKKKY